MKTTTVISKFKKVGIEFKLERTTFRAQSKTQLISFHDQDGDAICLSTSKLSTLEKDQESQTYEDISYRTYHESVKTAIEWVQRQDNK